MQTQAWKTHPEHQDPMAVWWSSGKSGGGSTGLLAAVGALVVAAGFALNTSGGSKSATPKPNKIKAKIKVSATGTLIHSKSLSVPYSSTCIYY